MATKKISKNATPPAPPAQLMDAGLSNIVGPGGIWFDALCELGTEMIGFVSERIKSDLQTQQEILHCKSVADLQHIQASFLQRATNQYIAETGKLVDMYKKPAAENVPV